MLRRLVRSKNQCICFAQVTGFNGDEYKSFGNFEGSETAFRFAYKEFKGKWDPTVSPVMLAIIGKPVEESYYVDTICIGFPGQVEYKCVHTTTKQQNFQQGPFENGINNIGEFFAIIHIHIVLEKR